MIRYVSAILLVMTPSWSCEDVLASHFAAPVLAQAVRKVTKRNVGGISFDSEELQSALQLTGRPRPRAPAPCPSQRPGGRTEATRAARPAAEPLSFVRCPTPHWHRQKRRKTEPRASSLPKCWHVLAVCELRESAERV